MSSLTPLAEAADIEEQQAQLPDDAEQHVPLLRASALQRAAPEAAVSPKPDAAQSADHSKAASSQIEQCHPLQPDVACTPERCHASATCSSSTSSSYCSRTSSSSVLCRATSQEPSICRICLEEDAPSAMEAPCTCTGTQRYAHHACIQKWVDEKGHIKCEVCGSKYKGGYVVPPPRIAVASADTEGAQLHLLHPLGGLYLTIAEDGARPAARSSGGAGGMSGQALVDYGDWDDVERPQTGSWLFTCTLFVLFALVLHHTMAAQAAADQGSSDAGGAVPPGSGGAGSGNGGSGPAGPGDDFAAGLSLFLVWVLTKAFLVAIPLYTVMRMAVRQGQQDAWEDGAVAPGAVYRSDHSISSASSTSSGGRWYAVRSVAPARQGPPRSGGQEDDSADAAAAAEAAAVRRMLLDAVRAALGRAVQVAPRGSSSPGGAGSTPSGAAGSSSAEVVRTLSAAPAAAGGPGLGVSGSSTPSQQASGTRVVGMV